MRNIWKKRTYRFFSEHDVQTELRTLRCVRMVGCLDTRALNTACAANCVSARPRRPMSSSSSSSGHLWSLRACATLLLLDDITPPCLCRSSTANNAVSLSRLSLLSRSSPTVHTPTQPAVKQGSRRLLPRCYPQSCSHRDPAVLVSRPLETEILRSWSWS